MSHDPLRRTALLLIAALALAGCGERDGNPAAPPAGATGAPGVPLVQSGKLKTCTSLEYPPFQFNEGGRVVGFDVDMIDLVARKLGVEQEIVDVKFDLIKSGAALNAGTCDIAAAGMTIKEDRKANLDFSRPYFPEVLIVLARKGSGVRTVDQAKERDLKVGVQTGTTSLDHAKEKGISPTEYDDSGKQLLALQSGQVDAVLQDLPTVNAWLKRPEVAENFEPGDEVSLGAQYGFAVKKGGNPELLRIVDETITAAVEDGTWERLYRQWIGTDPKQKPTAQ